MPERLSSILGKLDGQQIMQLILLAATPIILWFTWQEVKELLALERTARAEIVEEFHEMARHDREVRLEITTEFMEEMREIRAIMREVNDEMAEQSALNQRIVDIFEGKRAQ